MGNAAERDRQLLEQIWAFQLTLDAALAQLNLTYSVGLSALVDTRFPLNGDANCVIVERDDFTPAQLAEAADEMLAPYGIEPRTIAARDPAWGEDRVAGLEKLGYETERDLWMVLRGEPDRPAKARVEQVDLDATEEVRRATVLAESWADDAVADQFVARDPLFGEACRERWFGVRRKGRVVSCCRLLQQNGVGQVEDVATLEEARGQGFARAVVLAAVKQSQADGDELTFLGADADDWPGQLYERLGFEAVGVTVAFRRWPERD